MPRARVFLVATVGGLVGAFSILGISRYFERQEMQRAIERLPTAPPTVPDGVAGAVWGSASYGPGLFIVYPSIVLFAAIFFILLKWQEREG